MVEFYYHQTTGEKLGEILAKYPSKSSPGKEHQVRLAYSTQSVYCTCRGWVVKLNQTRHTSEEAECTHIIKYKANKPSQPVVIMTHDQFIRVRRVPVMKVSAKAAEQLTVQRRTPDAG